MNGFIVKRDSGLFIGDVDVAPASGTIQITENGEHNVASYATADVNVPRPSGKIEITENGTNIDVAQYAVADVDVPALTTKFEASTFPSYQIYCCEPVTNELYNLEIPLDNKYTELGADCCFANSNVKTVTIGDNITSIQSGDSQNQYGENNAVKNSAFGYCKNLTDVYGGTNITDVGNLSFVGCDQLSNMSALFESGNLKTVGDYAFYGCRSLSGTIKFNSLKSIGTYAFKYTQLNNIYILGTDNVPGGNPSIGEDAFYYPFAGGHLDKIIINTNGGPRLNIGDYAFGSDSGENVSILAILSNNITFSENSFYNFDSHIIDFYTHLNQADFTTWLNNLNDTTLKNAITNATNIHYEYSGDGSEL